jgi:hypothetical protein
MWTKARAERRREQHKPPPWAHRCASMHHPVMCSTLGCYVHFGFSYRVDGGDIYREHCEHSLLVAVDIAPSTICASALKLCVEMRAIGMNSDTSTSDEPGLARLHCDGGSSARLQPDEINHPELQPARRDDAIVAQQTEHGDGGPV